ncbi:MAG TPA: dUTP diphosphatase [Porticoccaceae bacterium]|nr:dUTP diphosphatase [Porticoccaceae bacterium]
MAGIEARIGAMLALQDEVNARIHPAWRTQGRPWYRAIWVECAELLDHHGWKWWKQQTPDRDQVQLELIDIWHFGLSALLAREVPAAAIADALAADAGAPGERDAEAFRCAVEAFAATTLSTRDFDLAGFAVLLRLAGLDVATLYRGYVGKNVLNRFRQDRGYRDGSYRKHWGGREDNEWLVMLCADLDPDSADFATDLYAALDACYGSGMDVRG